MTVLHWHPEVAAGLLGVLAAYAVGIGPLRRRWRLGPPATTAEAVAFLTGWGLLTLAVLGPLAAWAEHGALSVHMAQHLVLTLVVPPLWLAGTPGWLLRPLLAWPVLRRAGHGLTRPVPALLLASAALLVWHVPAAYQAALTDPRLHALQHSSLLLTALLGWWPLVGPLPEWPRPSEPARLLYVVAATIPMTAAAAPITLADGLLYPFYASPPLPWPLPPLVDQELAGTLMWMGGMVGYMAAGTVVFFRWALREEPEERPERRERRPRLGEA
jgi:putative membrane protein